MMTPEQRFWKAVQKTAGCWFWTGKTSPAKQRGKYLDVGGYGRFFYNGRHIAAHRYSYELLIGAIPDGHVVDHLCGVRNCVRPNHLEAVTQRENVLRQPNTGTETHCPNNHEYTPDNTYVTSGGYRQCRQCKLQAMRRFNAAHGNRRKVKTDG